jgi:hypothetical protein
MPAQHEQAHRKGRGKDKSDGSPQPCPKSCRDNDSDRRKPRTLAVNQGFDHVACDCLNDQEESGSHQDHRPTGSNRRGEEQRKYRGNERADIWNETHDHRKHAP